jgi:hypothetical protein
MKLNIDIECTPQEARTFLGLPDVEPMQQQVMLLIADRVRKNLDRMDPENLMKTWIPGAVKNWQELFGGLASVATGRSGATARTAPSKSPGKKRSSKS